MANGSPESIVVIWNPRASSVARADELRETLKSKTNVTLHETTSPEQAGQLARQAAESGAKIVAAAGGDGTINTVLNGISGHLDRVVFGVIPLGTGNDFARTLGFAPDAPEVAADLLLKPTVRKMDLVRVEHPGGTTFFANIATGGNNERAGQTLDLEAKQRWGPLVYLPGALTTLTDLTDYRMNVRIDDAPPEPCLAWNVFIGNGRTTAGGIEVSPHADPEDGLLELIIVLQGSPLDIAAIATKYMIGNHLEHERIFYRQARKVWVESDPPVRFSADGELIHQQPVTFTLQEKALSVIVGPDYRYADRAALAAEAS